jgi:nitrite reductase/ring-hydroxylating ferredoxin subunit
MTVKPYKRNLFQRIKGQPQTEPPRDRGCWSFSGETLSIDLARAPELNQPYGAIEIDDASLPMPVLIIRDAGGELRAFCNVCGHGGRKLDPVTGTETLCCCSMGKSTYDYTGKVIGGASEKNILPFDSVVEGGKMLVTMR